MEGRQLSGASLPASRAESSGGMKWLFSGPWFTRYSLTASLAFSMCLGMAQWAQASPLTKRSHK
eukprot:984699-Lingulodinium_polyedra.AAC.1